MVTETGEGAKSPATVSPEESNRKPSDVHSQSAGQTKRKRRRKRRKHNNKNPNSTGSDVVAADNTLPAKNQNKQVEVKQKESAPQRSHQSPEKNGRYKPNHHYQSQGQKKRRPQKWTSYRDRPAYAALDLGTNNCRLLVAVPDGSTFRVVDAFSRIVRLGEGIGHSNRLSDDAMDRAVGALKVCATKLKDRGIERVRLIATEACRIAENGETFLDRVLDETNLKLEIVNRETEARLAVTGCASLVDYGADGVILFDIGGGSSELVWLDLKNRRPGRTRIADGIRSWTSLPVGVVNISERHGGTDVTPESFEGMVAEVMALLDEFPEAEALSQMVAAGRVHMLGTSGTVTTLAGVHLGLERYDRRQVDGLWMSSDDVTAMTSKLLDMSFEERRENACIGRERADLVLAGCAILEAIRRKWPCTRLRVADRGLREGILYELMHADGVLKPSGRKKHRRRRQSGNVNRPQTDMRNQTQ